MTVFVVSLCLCLLTNKPFARVRQDVPAERHFGGMDRVLPLGRVFVVKV